MIGLRRRPHPAAGFTLIEMLVALVVLGIALAIMLPSLVNLVGNANRGAADSNAQAGAQQAVQMLQNDLRQSRANRSNSSDEQGTSVIEELTGTAPADHDIILAGPNILRFWADVSSSGPLADVTAGQELVTYALSTNDPVCDPKVKRSWCITRTVQSGLQTWREVLAHGTGDFPLDDTCHPGAASAPRMFCYKRSIPPGVDDPTRYSWLGWNRTCQEDWAHPATTGDVSLGARVETFHEKTPIPQTWIDSLDTITGIGVVPPGGGRTEGARSLSSGVTSISLRNRTSSEYRTAIMCGDR